MGSVTDETGEDREVGAGIDGIWSSSPAHPGHWTVADIISGEAARGEGGSPSPVSPSSGTCNPHPARPAASSPAPRGGGSARVYIQWEAVPGEGLMNGYRIQG